MIEVAKLPELTDEQIDTAWKRANTTTLTEHGPVLNRGLPSWRELRAAFPKPTPPPPSWSMDFFTAGVRVNDETVHVRLRRDGDGRRLLPTQARKMAEALVECADWIEANQ